MPSERSSVPRKVARSATGKRCGSVRSVSEAIPAGTSARARRKRSAIACARSRRVAPARSGAAAIERDVSSTNSTSASERTSVDPPRSTTGWAAARPRRSGAATRAANVKRSGRGSPTPSARRTRLARRSLRRNATTGTTPSRATSPAAGVRNETEPMSVAAAGASAAGELSSIARARRVASREVGEPRDPQSELEVVLRLDVGRVDLDRVAERSDRCGEQVRQLGRVARGDVRVERDDAAHVGRTRSARPVVVGQPQSLQCELRLRTKLETLVGVRGRESRANAREPTQRRSKREIVLAAEEALSESARQQRRGLRERALRGQRREADVLGPKRLVPTQHIECQQREQRRERDTEDGRSAYEVAAGHGAPAVSDSRRRPQRRSFAPSTSASSAASARNVHGVASSARAGAPFAAAPAS